MPAPRNSSVYPESITLGVDALLAFHRQTFGGYRMEATDDGGAGDGATDGDDGGGDKGGSTWTPPASQADLDKIVQERLSRVQKQYGMTPEEARQFKERADALDFELSSETEKAARKAAEEARADERAKFSPSLVRQAFKAEAKGVLDKDQLDGLLEDFNPKNYLDDSGDVDEAKVAARVAKLAGKRETSTTKTSRPLGQGHQSAANPSARDLGRAEAEKRFGKKQ